MFSSPNSCAKALIAVTLAIVSCQFQPSVALGESLLGKPQQTPPGMTPVTRTYGLLETLPTTTIISPGVLEITFRTIVPTPPATVYFGINTLDEELNYPRFRAEQREEGDALTQDHKIQYKFGSLVSKISNTAIEPRICWRAEVWVPSKNSTRFIEGRVYFNPETMGPTENIPFGPTVEQLAPNSVIIAFETENVVVGQVEYFSESTPSKTFSTPEQTITSMPNKKHEIRLTNLVPGQEYSYRVKVGETTTRSYQFQTPSASEPFQFAAMVDSREGVGAGLENFSGVNAFSLYTLGSDAYYRGADLIVFAGDLINGYTTSTTDFQMQLNHFRKIMEPVHSRIPIYESMGNHEALLNTWEGADKSRLSQDKLGAESAEAYFAENFVNPKNGPENEGSETPTYGENVYYFDHGNSRFFMLNNNYWWSSKPEATGGNLEGYILPNQLSWLREQVSIADQEAKIQNIFFAAQEPPFPNGGHTEDAMWYNGGDTTRDGQVNEADSKIVENRNELWEIVSSSPKSAAFITGDEHAYSRVLIDPLTTNVGHKRKLDGTEAIFKYPVMQVTSGGAGAPWYDVELDLPWTPSLKAHTTQPHYAYYKVDGPTVELEVYAQTGQLIDSAVLKLDSRSLMEKRSGK